VRCSSVHEQSKSSYFPAPLRQNGQTTLPLIPNEIYLAIFDCIAPGSGPLPEQHTKTFSALALVCRFFCAVALPRVFQCVVFFGASRKTTWARQIVTNAEPAKSVALYVKECHFKYWRTPKVQQSLFPFSMLYCRAMAHMTNIRKVEFHQSFVKKEHWETLAALKQLDCLHFNYCSFTENPPDQELSVRTVTLFNSPTPFTLSPIATSNLHTLETDELGAVLKLVTARQLAIKNFTLRHADCEMNVLLQVFEQLPDLESITIEFRAKMATSPLIGVLSLKKMFTRLRSFTINAPFYWEAIPRHITEKVCFMLSVPLPDSLLQLISGICDGPGTLPSLEKLDLLFLTDGGLMTTLNIVSDRLEDTIIPAFPNVECVRASCGHIRLEKNGWQRTDTIRMAGRA